MKKAESGWCVGDALEDAWLGGRSHQLVLDRGGVRVGVAGVSTTLWAGFGAIVLVWSVVSGGAGGAGLGPRAQALTCSTLSTGLSWGDELQGVHDATQRIMAVGSSRGGMK